MSVMIELKTTAGIGFQAWQSGPAEGPGLVIAHEWWGLNDLTRETAERFAELGYRVLAPDLYDGVVTADRVEAAKLMGRLSKKIAIEKLSAAVERVGAGAKRVAVVGWCMGGGLALRTAMNRSDKVVATVLFYGETVDNAQELARLNGPVLGIFADKDTWITKDMARRFDRALADARIPRTVKSFPADHAFFNPTSPNHDPACAAQAWELVTRFLAKELELSLSGGAGRRGRR